MLFNIATLLIDILAEILGGIFLLRFWMQAVRVRPPMSVGQFIFQLSDWLVRPLRSILPGVGGYDWASLVSAWLVALVATMLELFLLPDFAIQYAPLLSLFRLLQCILYGFMGLIIIEVIFSWINPHAPLAPLVRALNDPLMRPLRRIIPLIGNIDLSPLAAWLLLQVALQIVARLPGLFL